MTVRQALVVEQEVAGHTVPTVTAGGWLVTLCPQSQPGGGQSHCAHSHSREVSGHTAHSHSREVAGHTVLAVTARRWPVTAARWLVTLPTVTARVWLITLCPHSQPGGGRSDCAHSHSREVAGHTVPTVRAGRQGHEWCCYTSSLLFSWFVIQVH